MAIDVKVPAMGESISEGTILAWLVEPGDVVEEDQPLLELETDKVTAEVPAPKAGGVLELLAAAGDDVAVGSVVARLEPLTAGEAATSEAAQAGSTGTAPATGVAATAQEPAPSEPAPAAMPPLPAARRLLEESGGSADAVQGTGRRGQIRKEDVQAALTSRTPPPAEPTPPPAAIGPATADRLSAVPSGRNVRRVKMSRIRRAIATHLKETQNTVAMLTTFNEVDMSAVMTLRRQYQDSFVKKHGVKVGFMSFFIKAVVEALKAYPSLNGYIDGDQIVYQDYFDIGIAVSSDRGLVVPVIRDADRLSFAECEKTIGQMASLARDGKLTLDHLAGGTFTITNGGTFGSMLSTPILNGSQQSGILGMHNIVKRAVVVGDAIEIRPVMYVALSYDHRIVDGAEAVRFLTTIKALIEDPTRLLLEV